LTLTLLITPLFRCHWLIFHWLFIIFDIAITPLIIEAFRCWHYWLIIDAIISLLILISLFSFEYWLLPLITPFILPLLMIIHYTLFSAFIAIIIDRH
jgi:hypothetical protein